MAKESKEFIIGIDTGGTFTDATVLTSSGELHIDKAPTTPDDFSRGVMGAIEAASRSMGIGLSELLQKGAMIKHGTTLGTNSLITRGGAKVGFITTRGFEDTTLIMRAVGRWDGLSEEEIKHVAYVTKPPPLVPRQRIKGVRERVDFRGNIVVPINVGDVKEALRSLIEDHKVEAIGVSFLFGWLQPAHEKKVKELAEELYPDANVFYTYAHELTPAIKEYARANTVIINSYLGKLMRNYIDNLYKKLTRAGFSGNLMIMQANGGIVSREEMTPIGTLQSGPAGGVIAAHYMARILGHKNVISSDMGGTSFDVGLLNDGYWQYDPEPVVQRFRILQPMIKVESIGAGGGTICRVDPSTGRLLVGPQSAGAHPGPICYDEGGSEVTVTDADLILGYLDPDYFLGGRKKLNKSKAEEAIEEKIGRPLKMDAVEAAAGIYDVINSQMSDLIRKQVVRAGYTPEEYVIYSFGGAGPVHAAAYGSELGIKNIYIFPTSAVFSAFGIAFADVIHTLISTHRCFMPADPDELNARIEAVEEKLIWAMEREGFSRGELHLRRTFYLRYRRQMNEVGIVVPTKRFTWEDIAQIQTEFDKKYTEIYGVGSAYTQAGTELISFSVDAISPALKPNIKVYPEGEDDPSHALKGERGAYFTAPKRGPAPTRVYDYQRLKPNNIINGPAIVETPVTTVVVPPTKSARVDKYLNIMMEI